MVHSIELLLDGRTEAATRRAWEALSEAGLRTPAPTSRPHVTLVVADTIGSDVDALLTRALRQLPLSCRVGAVTVFGAGDRLTLVWLVVPTVPLLAFQAQVHAVCQPFVTKPASNTVPGEWTPHVTLARRVDPPHLAKAVTLRNLARDVTGSAVGLRHWDGAGRLEHEIT